MEDLRLKDALFKQMSGSHLSPTADFWRQDQRDVVHEMLLGVIGSSSPPFHPLLIIPSHRDLGPAKRGCPEGGERGAVGQFRALGWC